MKKENGALVFFGGILPHVGIALSVVMLSLFILDRFNRAMNFIGNGITKTMIVIWILMAAFILALAFFERAPRVTLLVGCLTVGLGLAVIVAMIAGGFGEAAIRYTIGAAALSDGVFSALFIRHRRRRTDKKTAAPRKAPRDT